jgi:hypothetical protein
MNRKKKLNKILNSRIKKMNAKKAHNSKPKYVSKADRALLEEQTQQESPECTEATE